ncbi:MAG: acetolactate synthase, large subunit, biosynthetic type [Candidatus Lambdaproteobacteria bacterium RIFOXYD2_FULL_50_16]|uniref:Acetolactate synthase n=1 Tax=Candidatus Lambdaproteobacteria bacterium RIFOXYD2_FULL_50_16 TaxID=1817772 RepID=A0A1F6G846_9PROT|nr:MAG: acetolactate synthase, large subunit, biosynthetic type [Candidatus Lambdaproteobacteria bacterium RIFOXYD2_FULL_50_16]
MASKTKGSPLPMTGAKALVRMMEDRGVEVIFGYPGGANLPIYDELRQSKIQHILTRHEAGAAHMAEGYARVAGSPGVCLATSGPGATNLVTGLADALLDSIPVVAITGQIHRNLIGTDAFQEVDCFNITMPVTKHNELIKHESDLVAAIDGAFYIANSGRKGPVLLDIPVDVQLANYPHDLKAKAILPGYQPTVRGNIGQIKRALRALDRAERPLVLIGGGVEASGAVAELLSLVRKCRLPVVRTLMATGVIGADDELYQGMIGTHGNSLANRLVNQDADVILAIGVKMSNRSIVKPELFAKKAKLIQIDIDPAEIGKNLPADIPIVGDIKETLRDMNRRIEEKPICGREPWILGKHKRSTTMLPKTDAARVMELVFDELSKIDQKLHVTTDVGRHQMWANHHMTNPKHLPLFTSGGLGTMGFGLPAAIGCWFADKETPVVNISGDGSFMMNMQEFLVAVEHKVPLTVIVLNDFRLGMIRELQNLKYGKRHIANDFNRDLDYPLLAQAMGGWGETIVDPKRIGPALKKAIQSRKPNILCFDLELLDQRANLSLKEKAG